MFITPGIEQLILSGKAQYKTFNCGLGAFYSMPIPSKNTIVVLGIEWTPFLNPAAGFSTLSWNQFLRRNEYQLRITDYSGKYHLLQYRNYLKIDACGNDDSDIDENATVEEVLKHHSIQSGAKILTPLYLPFQGEQVTFAVSANQSNLAVFSENPFNSTTQEFSAPAGYKGYSVLQNATLAPILDYLPTTLLNSPSPIAFTGSATGEYYYGINDGSLITSSYVPEDLRSMLLPLFTVHYAIIRENVIDKIL